MGARKVRIALVAGEVSGDILGSRLIQSLKQKYPNAIFEGVGGEQMLAEGMHVFHPMESLAVMGFSEVLPKFKELFFLRKRLIQFWIDNPPDVFVGIDAPDFNFVIEKKLSSHSIKVCHYVSPSVWAWREKRISKLVGKLDLMLTLLPFEVPFYESRDIDSHFVGHPLADEIPFNPEKNIYRKQLGLPQDKAIVAVLPGSRHSEIKFLAEDFFKALIQVNKQFPDVVFAIPFVSDSILEKLKTKLSVLDVELPVTFIERQSREVMMASDQVLLASGTAVLEGALVGRPMVAAYRVSPITAGIIRALKMIKSKFYTLPNVLADKLLVPEFIQEDIIPESLAAAVIKQMMMSKAEREKLLDSYSAIHQQLKQNASEQAASAIARLIEKH